MLFRSWILGIWSVLYRKPSLLVSAVYKTSLSAILESRTSSFELHNTSLIFAQHSGGTISLSFVFFGISTSGAGKAHTFVLSVETMFLQGVQAHLHADVPPRANEQRTKTVTVTLLLQFHGGLCRLCRCQWWFTCVNSQELSCLPVGSAKGSTLYAQAYVC